MIRDSVCENQSRSEHLFQSVKNFVTEVIKIPENILLDEMDNENNNIQVFIDKSIIEVGKSKI